MDKEKDAMLGESDLETDLENENSDPKSQDEENIESGDNAKPKETPEQYQARIKRQVEKAAEKAGRSVEDYLGFKKDKTVAEKGDTSEEKYARLVLRYEGFKDKAEQDEIISYANWKKIDVEEAMKSPVVLSAIKEIRDKKSVPEPSSRTGTGGTISVDTLVSRYKAGKYLTVSQMAQVRKKLRG